MIRWIGVLLTATAVTVASAATGCTGNKGAAVGAQPDGATLVQRSAEAMRQVETVRFSLTVDNASSAHYTLKVMTVVALTVTPLILLYQAWTYQVFRARGGVVLGEEGPPPPPYVDR